MKLPVEKPYKITSPFAMRENPFQRGKTENHQAIDFISTNDAGQPLAEAPVLAMAGGKIILDFDNYDHKGRWTDGRMSVGNYVIIQHNIGGKIYFSRYCHLKENFVSHGETVEQGQVIGIYADVGRSCGGHVHVDVFDYPAWKPVNYTNWLEDL